jgi:hypothetical protein
MPAGRPSIYTQDLADLICEELADGKSLRTVCKADEMPDKRTIFRWLRTNEEFRHQYEKAKAESADCFAEEIIEIADDGINDYVEREGGYVYNGEHVQRSRLRVDARKWIASKLKPKKYGDRMTAEHTGADGGPIEHEHRARPFSFESPEKPESAEEA